MLYTNQPPILSLTVPAAQHFQRRRSKALLCLARQHGPSLSSVDAQPRVVADTVPNAFSVTEPACRSSDGADARPRVDNGGGLQVAPANATFRLRHFPRWTLGSEAEHYWQALR